MAHSASLDFAYRYPFSSEAKALVVGLGSGRIDAAKLQQAKTRVEDAINGAKWAYRDVSNLDDIKRDYVIVYVYSRMLVSAMKNPAFIKSYVAAEASRSAGALEGDSVQNVIKACGEIGIGVKEEGGEFGLRFTDFLRLAPRLPGFELANQSMRSGVVTVDKHRLIKVMENAVMLVMEKGLPIDQKAIPKAIIETSKTVKRPVQKIVVRASGQGSSWIERLAQTPIPDCRHRTVNLILAPYFVNVREMSIEDATKTISAYIELCKTVNPNTSITERYISYQCKYAKDHGLRPLSLSRAKTELFSSLDMDIFGEQEQEKGKS